MEPNEIKEERRVVVETPDARKEVVTERTQTEPRESGLSTGTVALIAVFAIVLVGIVIYIVTNRNASESANRNANIEIASQTNSNQPPPATIIQQPAPAQQAPIIIQQPAPEQQAPVIIQQPATSQRENTAANDDANMQDIATRKLSANPDMGAVSVSISDSRAVLTGSVNSSAAKAKAEQLVKGVRGVKSVDNKIVTMG
ncbi:MAG: BON domain-containing protein [bacterium]